MRKSGLCLMMVLLPHLMQAQYLRFTMQVDPEVTAGTVQILNFGQIGLNSSAIINPNDPNSGWFRIVAINALQVFLNFTTPEYLYLNGRTECEEDNCRLPLSLRYAYFTSFEPVELLDGDLIPLVEGLNYVNLPVYPVPRREGVSEQYIYIYINVSGELEVGDVIPGVYLSELFLEVTY
jgi:hypothetical protein